MEGFFYPNELETAWTLLIVLYPYITGLVAGAFIISALYHTFGIKPLRPVAKLSLVTALSFLLVAPLPLLAHLGRPERALEIFWTPNFKSAMAGFGYIWLFYLLLVLLEIWLVFRREIVEKATTTQGLKGLAFRFLTLGIYDISEKTLKVDGKAIKVLSAIGIPSAFLLHGYVGFIFGAVKANPWWSTPLMPLIFLMSAIVSGVALLIVIYIVTSRLRRVPIDQPCLRSLGNWLLGFLLVDTALAGLELLSLAYEGEESWEALSQLISTKLAGTYLGVQLLGGVFLPVVLLVASGVLDLEEKAKTFLRLAASLLVLIGIFAMRWNVVIGGQLFSKSLSGFKSYIPEIGGREGVLAAGGILLLPLVIFAVISYFLPPWEEKAPYPTREREAVSGVLGQETGYR